MKANKRKGVEQCPGERRKEIVEIAMLLCHVIDTLIFTKPLFSRKKNTKRTSERDFLSQKIIIL